MLSFLSVLRMSAATSVDYAPQILEALETMRLGVLASKDKVARFKAAAYKKAMGAIEAARPITRPEDVKGLAGVGKEIQAKVTEIIATGGLAAAERVKERTDIGALELFMGIHGVGPAKARALVEAGYRSLADLHTAISTTPKLLTAAQKLGLKHYADARLRIPRAEIVEHEAFLKHWLPAWMPGTIVGSYRRGAANSGDIDLLLTYAEGTEENASKWLGALIESFIISGYVVDTLVSGPKKWMGYVRLEGNPVRRLDILITPPVESPYAVLYFTGSDKFNIAFRKHCLTRGYSLNEHTLTPVREGMPAPPVMTREEDIFTFVGLLYVPPTERVDGRQIRSANAAAGAGTA